MSTLRRIEESRGAARAARHYAAALAFGALGLCGFSTSNAYAQTGWIRQYTGPLPLPQRTSPAPPCGGGIYCQFWAPVDRNAFTARIAAGNGHLYQMHYSGAIYEYPGVPCTDFCSAGWWFRGYDPATKAIYADGDLLYKLHRDGSVWRSIGGTAWSAVEGPDPRRLSIAVGGGKIASLYDDGGISLQIALDDQGNLYQLTRGVITVLGSQDSTLRQLDGNLYSVAIAAGGSGRLYQLHVTGAIWRWKGTACESLSPIHPALSFCPGWERLDNNGATVKIVAAGDELYQLHRDGSLWRYTGTPCDGDFCPGWEMIMGDGVGQVAAAGDRLYVLSAATADRPWIFRPVCSECL